MDNLLESACLGYTICSHRHLQLHRYSSRIHWQRPNEQGQEEFLCRQDDDKPLPLAESIWQVCILEKRG